MSPVQTTISGAMSSERLVGLRLVVSRSASRSGEVQGGDNEGLERLASEVRVERRESGALTPFKRRPFPEPIDCLRRILEGFPIIPA